MEVSMGRLALVEHATKSPRTPIRCSGLPRRRAPSRARKRFERLRDCAAVNRMGPGKDAGIENASARPPGVEVRWRGCRLEYRMQVVAPAASAAVRPQRTTGWWIARIAAAPDSFRRGTS